MVMLPGMGAAGDVFGGERDVCWRRMIWRWWIIRGCRVRAGRAGGGGRWVGQGLRTMAEAVWAGGGCGWGSGEGQFGGEFFGRSVVPGGGATRPGRVAKMMLANPACYPQGLPFMYRVARVPLVGELMMAMMRAEQVIEGVEYIGYVDKGRFEPELRERNLAIMRQRRNRFRLMEMIRHLPHDERDTIPAVHMRRLQEIACPVLVSWGEQDPLLTAGAGERLARELGKGVYRGYADLPHMPHECRRSGWDRSGARFLNA